MRRVLFVASIVAAVAVGLWQGPSADTAERVMAEGGTDPCIFSGTADLSCTVFDGCTSGNLDDVAVRETTGGQPYKSNGSRVAGTCYGSSPCPTGEHNTDKLTTEGCGG
jgi:hypothetical protein